MIASLQPWWWLALPVLLVPLWLHMRRRERHKAGLLATARFLPATTPQQQRTPRWQERLLLLFRLLLLLALIAWLAVTVMPWRGDTVLATSDIPPGLSAREQAVAGLSSANTVQLSTDPLQWLATHQHEFRGNARVLVLARALPMPALLPQFSLPVTVRVFPDARKPAAQTRHIVLASTPEREPQWRALVAAFGAAGDRFDISQVPDADTELVIWDRDGNPPAAWKSPLWWRTGAAPAGAIAIEVNGLRLAIADSAQGRVWRSPDWPAASGSTAAAIYETWQQLHLQPGPYPMPSAALVANPAVRSSQQQRPSDWLAWALLLFFILERITAHVRRR
ncbi:BatA domain-containing protein [Massilia sp. SM-13]|uniref:BatA domain-containing protein n=1 Tax=Pseudoduganella rhizocola TaxID=3382643 RepID=UPI0038B5589E